MLKFFSCLITRVSQSLLLWVLSKFNTKAWKGGWASVLYICVLTNYAEVWFVKKIIFKWLELNSSHTVAIDKQKIIWGKVGVITQVIFILIARAIFILASFEYYLFNNQTSVEQLFVSLFWRTGAHTRSRIFLLGLLCS